MFAIIETTEDGVAELIVEIFGDRQECGTETVRLQGLGRNVRMTFVNEDVRSRFGIVA